jgi:hypothetical protein
VSADCGLRGLDLLDAVIAQIEAHPETWNQDEWRCESGMCVAGWVAEMAGGQWLTSDPGAMGSAPSVHFLRRWALIATPEDDTEFVRVIDGTGVIQAGNRASRLLGLTQDQADDLFSEENDLQDIKDFRNEISAGSAA